MDCGKGFLNRVKILFGSNNWLNCGAISRNWETEGRAGLTRGGVEGSQRFSFRY